MARPNMSQFLRNWRDSDLPVHGKVAAALRNNLRKATRLQDCCGNYGEPGC